MLNSLTVKNFKSLQNLRAPFGKLTILAGLNGSGKSSILQSIALLKQSFDKAPDGHQLFLRGPLVQLGRTEDILFESSLIDEISIDLEIDDKRLSWTCETPPEADALSAQFEGDTSILQKAFTGFQFIQADRLTPALQYMQAGTDDRDSGYLGSHGEFTVDFLSRNKELKISEQRNYPIDRFFDRDDAALHRSIAPTNFLLDSAASWLQLLSPGVIPLAEQIDLAESASLRFEYKGYKKIQRAISSRQHRPSHVGFGLTYSLPIIVACLAAPSGSLLMLENPEAHLHPRGQLALGLLLALSANDGVQIVVETHSDHLLNGIRIAAKQKDIEAKDVSTLFFTRDIGTGVTNIEMPMLLDNGRFNNWPIGFFDEWGNALEKLLEE